LLVVLEATREEASRVLSCAATGLGWGSPADTLQLLRTLCIDPSAPAASPPFPGADPLKTELLRGLPELATVPHPSAPLLAANKAEEGLVLEESLATAMHAAIEDDVATGGDGRGWHEPLQTQEASTEEVGVAQGFAVVDAMAFCALKCGAAVAVHEVRSCALG
jgi:hypothetical protein